MTLSYKNRVLMNDYDIGYIDVRLSVRYIISGGTNMPTISVTEARSNLYKLLEQVNNSSTPLLITNKNGKNGYLIGEEDFNAILETMYLNSIEGLVESIISEGKTPYNQATDADDLDW